MLSSSGVGVALGSASGFGAFACFFFVGFLSRSTGTKIRRGRWLPVCSGITTSLYLRFLDFRFVFVELQPPAPRAIQTMTKLAIRRRCMVRVPLPVRESGTEFRGKNNRTAVAQFLQNWGANHSRDFAKSLGLNGEADALLCASQ